MLWKAMPGAITRRLTTMNRANPVPGWEDDLRRQTEQLATQKIVEPVTREGDERVAPASASGTFGRLANVEGKTSCKGTRTVSSLCMARACPPLAAFRGQLATESKQATRCRIAAFANFLENVMAITSGELSSASMTLAA